jgi:dipeptidyl aminopeptidase/acylaminoacyl peptidase
MLRLSFGGAAAALLMSGVAIAAPASLSSDASIFGAREAAGQVALSPSGNKVVMLVAGPGKSTAARVFDLQTGAATTAVSSNANPETLHWCRFASDTQLVCQYGGNVRVEANILGFSRLITVGTDGKGLKSLGQTKSANDAVIRQFDGKILDWLTDGSGSVLMARSYVPEVGMTGSRISRSKEGLAVDRIDLASMKVTTLEPPRPRVSGYMTDGRGQVRIRTITNADDKGILTGTTDFAYRRAGSSEWVPLGRYDSRDGSGIYPVGIEAESNSVFVLRKLDGRDALYRMSLDGSLTTTLVARHPAVDIDGITRIGRGQRVIGYTYADDRRRSDYFDGEFQKLSAMLGKALPNLPIIDFAGASADGSKLLIFAGSDTAPGTYYWLDRKTKEMSELASVRPALAPKALSPVKSIHFAASDGTSIPAYLTIPAASSGRNLPAVVLPHGGPSSRDEWGFDWLAQFLAARGYAVIQPNYRGSAGYGDDFQNENGFRNWQTAIGDVGDAARYLVKEGIAAKDRVAIVGWSYGGYAALQTAAMEPDLFKSVVAIAPVTDLGLLKRESEGFTNSELVRDFVGSGANARNGSPLRNAAAIKAPVLLVHGDLDTNVGIDHSLKMESALTAGGKTVTLLRYKGLDHQLEDSAARTEMLTRIGELLERTIGH